MFLLRKYENNKYHMFIFSVLTYEDNLVENTLRILTKNYYY